MKYTSVGFLLGAMALVFVGLYFWLAEGQIDHVAFFSALVVLGHVTYLRSTRSCKAG